MSALRPCTDCGRHVRDESLACPFCGAERTPEVARPASAGLAGGLTRAAIFASAALLVPACGGSSEETVEQDQVEQTSGGGDGEQTTDTQTDVQTTDVQETSDQVNIAPPYGAPPADDSQRAV